VKKPITDWNRLRETFVENHLRRASLKWPAIAEAKKRARTTRKINLKTNRLAWHAQCAGCCMEFLESKLVADHIEPVVPVERDYSVGAYDTKTLGERISRLLPGPEAIQMLCFLCHSMKTEAENEERQMKRKVLK
jgi:hypothetical protein